MKKLTFFFKPYIAFALFCFPLIAAAETGPALGYRVLTEPTPVPTEAVSPGRVKVVEFFSYGCPWCYKLDPYLQTWLKAKPKNVDFERIPVTFEPQWQTYSQIFFVAKNLHVEEKLHAKIFDVAQNPLLGLQSYPVIKNFFVTNGVSEAIFDKAYNDNIKMNEDFQKANQLTKSFKIMQIPTVIVDGKYEINSAMTNGDNQKFINVLQKLVSQETSQLKAHTTTK